MEEVRDALRMNEKAESIKSQIGSMEQENREGWALTVKDVGGTSPLIHPPVVPTAVFLLSASSCWGSEEI